MTIIPLIVWLLYTVYSKGDLWKQSWMLNYTYANCFPFNLVSPITGFSPWPIFWDLAPRFFLPNLLCGRALAQNLWGMCLFCKECCFSESGVTVLLSTLVFSARNVFLTCSGERMPRNLLMKRYQCNNKKTYYWRLMWLLKGTMHDVINKKKWEGSE